MVTTAAGSAGIYIAQLPTVLGQLDQGPKLRLAGRIESIQATV
jgi:hypothetical protein